jgi:hypothetical protein
MSSLSNQQNDNLMKQYQMMVDIYKFHFEMVLKFILFYYAITGAILSFYLTQPNAGFMRTYALLLSSVLGFGFSVFAFLGALEVSPMKDHIAEVARDLHLKVFPTEKLMNRLKFMLIVTSVLSSGIAICLLWLVCKR